MTASNGESGHLADWQRLLKQAGFDSSALAFGLFDHTGVMIEGNRGLQRLLCDRSVGEDCSGFFENPDFFELWRRGGIDGGFQGLLSLGDRKRVNRSILARARRVDGLLELVGEVDVNELDQVNERLISLNQTVNDLQRDLLRKNRRLEQALTAITRKERLTTALAEINRAIQTCETERDLLERLCEIAVSSGGFKLATASRFDHGQFVVLAAAGSGACLTRLDFSTDPSRSDGGSLAARAYRTGERQVSNDYLADPSTAAWHAFAREHGISAAAAEAIVGRHGVHAALQLYAGSIHYFGDDELQLLGQIASDVGLALDAFSDRQALALSEGRYQRIFEHAPTGLVHYDPDGTIIDCNDAYIRIVGSSRERIVGLNLLRDLKDQQVIDAVRESLTEGRSQIDLVYRSVTADKVTPIRGFFSAVRSPNGTLLSGIGIVEDFSDRYRLEQQLKLSEERFRLAVDAAAIGVWEYDLRTRRLHWDDWMHRLHGVEHSITPVDLAGWRRLVDPADRRRVLHRLRPVMHSETTGSVEFRVRPGAGGTRYLRLFARLHQDSDGRPHRLMGVCLDITQQHLADQQIRQLAFYDPLTNLANRRLLLDRLDQTLARCRRQHRHGALLLLDLDGFKRVNDTRGHDVGDELLIELASRLRGELRQADTVARLGGDEFVVLAEGLEAERADAAAEAKALADKVLTIARRPYLLASAQDTAFHCGASIGVALFDGGANAPTRS